MPEANAFRLELSASPRARRIRLLAQALTGLAAAACVWAMLLSPSPWRSGAALIALGALVAILRPVGRGGPEGQLAIDSGGVVCDLTGEGAAIASPRYCGAAYVCLQVPGRLLPIWIDMLPADAWRRLQVACRWTHKQDSGRPSGRLPPSERTK